MAEQLLHKRELKEQIREWLREDMGPAGDVTSLTTISAEHRSRGIIHAKEDCVLAGLPVAELVFHVVDESLHVQKVAEEGAVIHKGDVLAIVEGSTRSILEGERLALNQLQRLSGIATKTRAYAALIEDLPVRLADTRKTTPGHRMLEKYAVRIGGGHNHRYGLYDAVMIKDNHIKGAGGIAAAVGSARSLLPHTMKIEVETESLEQALEAAEAGADIIMLDNMSPVRMKEAVGVLRLTYPGIVIEASGGVNLATVRSIAETGVDIISVGGLTSSIQAIDISLDVNEKKAGAQ